MIVVIFAKLIGLSNNVSIYTLDLMRVFWANVNILQTVVFFSLLIQEISSQSKKPVVNITLAKSEAVRILGFEDRGWLIHRDKRTILENRTAIFTDSLQLL